MPEYTDQWYFVINMLSRHNNLTKYFETNTAFGMRLHSGRCKTHHTAQSHFHVSLFDYNMISKYIAPDASVNADTVASTTAMPGTDSIANVITFVPNYHLLGHSQYTVTLR